MERTRVIIADDESLIRMDLREMLTNLGYLVVGEVCGWPQRSQPGARAAAGCRDHGHQDAGYGRHRGRQDPDRGKGRPGRVAQRLQPAGTGAARAEGRRRRLPGEAIPRGRVDASHRGGAGSLQRVPDWRTRGGRPARMRWKPASWWTAPRASSWTHRDSATKSFRKIQKMSMNNRKPMRAVADAIILAQQVDQ